MVGRKSAQVGKFHQFSSNYYCPKFSFNKKCLELPQQGNTQMENDFFSGHGETREFCDCQGKFEKLSVKSGY